MYEAIEHKHKQAHGHIIQLKHKSARFLNFSYRRNENPIIQRALHVAATCCIRDIEKSARSKNADQQHHWVLNAMNSIAVKKRNELFQCAEPKSLNCVLKNFDETNPVITKNDVQTIHWKDVKYYYIKGESQDIAKSEDEKARESNLNGKNASPCQTCLTWIGSDLKPLPIALKAVDDSVPSNIKDLYNGFEKINQKYEGRYNELKCKKQKNQ